MRRLHLFFILFVLVISQRYFAQVPGIVGTNAFYAGKWLEIGEQNNGDFGAATVPAGYHDHCVACDNPTPLAEVYDYGHDGWAVGAPAYMGDYTYPGSPFEGWEIQYGNAGTAKSQMFCTGTAAGTYANAGGMVTTASAPLTYTDAGGQQIGEWKGTAVDAGNTLTIQQYTEVDTFASWVVVTAKMYNTSATTIDSVYYFRSCDPDNNESWGGSFATENYIDYQNDVDHRVQVHASTSIPAPGNQYPFALGTKDCRAVCLIYDLWPLSSTVNLNNIWKKTYGGVYTGESTGDIAIGLVFKVGDICPGDSNFVSYAYTFNGAANGIDSALPEPTLDINNVIITPAVAPNATYDTFNTCLYPGMTTLPADLVYATTGDWTWSNWSWSPATGLATTSGVVNSININSLPPNITYTIVGTGYSSACAAGTGNCGTRTFYLTIHTCNGATVNSPCLGDSLIFNAPGDSTGATYVWVGPDNFTTTVSTSQTFTVYPSVWADTGTYHVIKTVAGTSDTSTAVVILYPNPTVTASSNSPLCQGAVSTLSLTATPGTVPISSYSWTGSAGFTSALQDPTITPFLGADTGLYTVIVASAHGCKDTAHTEVLLLPPPGPPIVTGTPAYCYGVTFIPFTVIPNTGATVYWYPSAAGGVGSTTPPTVNTTIPGTYTFYYGQTIGLCESPIDSIRVIVYPQILPSYTYSMARGCTEDTVFFVNTSTGFTTDLWNFRDGSANSTAISPEHIFVTQGIYAVKLTDYFAICSDTFTLNIDTRHHVTAEFSAHFDTICVGQSSTMTDDLSTATVGSPAGTGAIVPGVIETYTYNWADGTPNTTLLNNNTYGHTFNTPGIFHVVLTTTDSIGCTATAAENVYVVDLTIDSWHDTSLCLKEPLPLTNLVIQNPNLDLNAYTYSWTSPTGMGYLDSADAHIPTFSNAFGSYTYTLTVELHEDWGICVAKDTMIVNSVLGKKLAHVTANATIMYGGYVQLNADSLVNYWWIPDNGSLSDPNINDPIARPDTTTTYCVYGMDKYGCVDSAFVTVRVDSTMNECIPTAFTPNNDGLNDYFHPVGLIFQNIVDFRVYNRWGQQVFYTNSASSPGWDGKLNGVPQDMDTYFYTIIVYRPDNGQNVVYKGDVTLIR